MRNRLPSWVLLLYLAIDLANPFVPGAFRFTPDQGLVWVEGTSRCREGAEADIAAECAVARPERTVTETAPVAVGRLPGVPFLATWVARVRSGDPPARDLPPPDSDEH